jgi:signal transduction histidine kinase
MSRPEYWGARLLRWPPVVLIVSVWMVLATLNLLIGAMSNDYSAHPLEICITDLSGLTLSLLLYAGARKLMVSTPSFALPLIALMALSSGTVLWVMNVLLQFWFGGHGTTVHGLNLAPRDYFIRLRYNWLYFNLLFFLQAVVFALLNYARALDMRERQLVEARLAALRFQLNPHFLFNTLNAISTLVAEAGATEAEQMIARLSSFLRISLSAETTGMVSLALELDTVQAYLDIESVRFGDRLAVQYACGAGLADAQVPSLILQPLVENAIKYAVALSKEQVTVSIEARAAEEDLILVVEDNGQVQTADVHGTGVGLRNVAARLEALYGRRGRIEATRRERGFIAIIRLPLSRVAA